MGRFFALLLATLPLLAADGVVITGVVLDPSGVPIPSSSVTLKSPEAPDRSAQTGFDGSFQFDGLAPGNYQIVVQRDAFQTSTTRVRVGARAPNPLRIRLRLADLLQEITVSDPRNQINSQAADNLDIIRVDREMIDKLPAMGNDVLGSVMRFIDPTALDSGGVEIVVDGMATSERSVARSAIQEVRINQNPYSAEFAGMGRSRIEIITSPGATEYHGAVNYFFRDHHLDARPAFAVTRPPDRRHIFDGNFTGPLGNGKRTSFLISAEAERIGNNPIVFARTLAGDVRENHPVTVGEAFVSARLNHQVNQRNQLALRYEFTDEFSRGGGVGGFRLPEVATRFGNREHHIYVQHRGVLSPRLVHEFQLRTGRHNNPTVSARPGVARIVVLDAFTGGGAQADTRFTENHFQWHETLSYSAGRHFLKTGVTSPDLSRRGHSDRTNFEGTFTFSSLEDYRLGRPFSFQQQRGNGYTVIWQRELGAFFMDDFRVRPGLSLSYGFRWDWQDYYGDHNNFSPRLAFAWAPRKSRKTVLRGGAGYFYDRGSYRPLADTIRYDGQRLRDILVSNPSYPNPFAGGSTFSPPPNITRFAPGIRTPYNLQYSFGVERQILKTTLAVNYRGTKGTKFYRSRDVNAPLPGALERRDPSIGILRHFESSAGQRSHHLEVILRTQSAKRVSGTVQYVLGDAKNNSDGVYAFPANNYDLSLDWAPHDEIRRHRFAMAGTMKVSPRLGDLGLSMHAANGGYYNMTTGRDDNHDGFAADRPPGVRRNSLRGPGFLQLDARWSREIALDHKKKEKGPVLTVGADASNLINRVNYGNFVGNISSPFYRQPVSSREPRRLMLFARLKF